MYKLHPSLSIHIHKKKHLRNCSALAVRVVLPSDMVGLVQAGEDSIPKPEQLVGEVTSAPFAIPFLVALVASLLTRRIEDSVKGEDDMGARVSTALGVNCPGFPGLARCHKHVVGLQGWKYICRLYNENFAQTSHQKPIPAKMKVYLRDVLERDYKLRNINELTGFIPIPLEK